MTTTLGNAAHAAEAAVHTENGKLALLREDETRINRELAANEELKETLRARLEQELATCRQRAEDLKAQLAKNGRDVKAQQEKATKAQLLADAARELDIQPEEPADLNVLGQPQEYEEFQRGQTPTDGVPVATGLHDTQQMPPVGEQ